MAKNRDKRRNQILNQAKEGTVSCSVQEKEVRSERTPPPIMALNATQALYLGYLRTHPQVFVLGPAGTGKTSLAATYAADLYRNRTISKIILTRPNVPCGPRSVSFRERWKTSLRRGRLRSPTPFATGWPGGLRLRGEERRDRGRAVRSHARSLLERRLRPSRRGAEHHGRGDQDVPDPHRRGLLVRHQRRSRAMRSCLGFRSPQAIDLVREQDLPVPVVEFSIDDVVRSGLCGMWVRAFEGPGGISFRRPDDGFVDAARQRRAADARGRTTKGALRRRWRRCRKRLIVTLLLQRLRESGEFVVRGRGGRMQKTVFSANSETIDFRDMAKALGTTVAYPRNSSVFLEGDSPAHMYVILSGAVESERAGTRSLSVSGPAIYSA